MVARINLYNSFNTWSGSLIFRSCRSLVGCGLWWYRKVEMAWFSRYDTKAMPYEFCGEESLTKGAVSAVVVSPHDPIWMDSVAANCPPVTVALSYVTA